MTFTTLTLKSFSVEYETVKEEERRKNRGRIKQNEARTKRRRKREDEGGMKRSEGGEGKRRMKEEGRRKENEGRIYCIFLHDEIMLRNDILDGFSCARSSCKADQKDE